MSTAKSLANSYVNNKRQALANGNKSSTLMSANTNGTKFKSSTSNLAGTRATAVSASKLRSTSMTNLLAGEQVDGSPAGPSGARMLQRPASRNALDSIHNGMNAKYAQVQSKVYLQNIKPAGQASSTLSRQTNSPQNQHTSSGRRREAGGARPAPTSSAARVSGAQTERSQLLSKLRTMQTELEQLEQEREQLRHELEREKADKLEQVQQLKLEIQEKMGEHDKQNEEYHQKLLEAYELADQNRRAADTVLSESRQRDEESRKKTDELEGQLAELREFVSMKEEMTGKMYELREQLREERERYEEQLKSLHQLFESEKISGADQNSNYFGRLKPSLESSESIDRACRQCRAQPGAKLRKSQNDIYGSKLSTRMQDGARTAWRASKQFASSVITGGVGLSACRSCSRRKCSGRPGEQPATGARQEHFGDHLGDEHTSVVQVGACATSGSAASPALSGKQEQSAPEEQSAASVIRVDQNNKLTIVTKFSDPAEDSRGPQSASLELANVSSAVSSASSSSSSGERSRCESSSSGRGTSSDACSADSQLGGDEEPNKQADANNNSSSNRTSNTSNSRASAEQTKLGQAPELPAGEVAKQHRRRSSLFKASRLLGGSQVSLSKLRSLFASSAKANLTDPHKQQQQQQQPSGARRASVDMAAGQLSAADHLERSRLRCIELNQAIARPSLSAAAIQGDAGGSSGDGQLGQGAREADADDATTLKQQQVDTVKPTAERVLQVVG